MDIKPPKKPPQPSTHTEVSQSTHAKGHKPKKSKGQLVLMGFAILLLLLGIYILFLLFSPKILPGNSSQQTKEQTNLTGNRIIVPVANVNAEILPGDESILDKAAWHRFPERGNPEKGGNFIVTGHSFVWGYTPQQIKERSVFYGLDATEVGDEITIRWNDKEYRYQVAEKKTVKPQQVEIEATTKEPQLTVYTCTLGGAADGRIVLIAKLKS